MKRVLSYILGMEMAGVLMVVIAFAIGFATFIENDFGTSASKALVYNALWFELIIALIFVNLLVNSIKINPIKTRQWSVFLFHISFLLIILGAAFTRYVGFEGMMSIREGATSNTFLSEHTYIKVSDASGKELAKTKVLFSQVSDDEKSLRFSLNGKDYNIETSDFVSNAYEYIDEAPGGMPMVEITQRSKGDFQNYSIAQNESLKLGGKNIGFQSNLPQDIMISQNNGELFLTVKDTTRFFDMMTGNKQILKPDSAYPIVFQKLYTMGSFSWVFSKYYPSARLAFGQHNQKTGVNGIQIEIENAQGREIVDSYLLGASGVNLPKSFTIDGEQVNISYGSEIVTLPFAIKLRDFQLERYPASNSPSSYASEVTLIDASQNINMDYRIFMNNVLDHRRYRFFQSSYDQDEMGTVLSVNHDFLGMITTYLGYALMMLTMFLALFAKNSRFRMLMRKTTKTAVVVFALLLTVPLFVNAQGAANCVVEKVPQSQVDLLSQVLVQGHSGRFQPFNTISGQVVRKFSRSSTYQGLNSDQILLGMMMNPEFWMRQELIKVSNAELKKLLGKDDSRFAFADFFDPGGHYRLEKYVDEAYNKKPAERGTFDKDVITVDERVNVFFMAMNTNFIKIFPIPGMPNESWLTPSGPFNQLNGDDSAFAASVFNFYIQSLKAGMESGNYADAEFILKGITQYQSKYFAQHPQVIKKMNFEILNNKINIFDRLFGFYGISGFFMLVLLFVHVLSPKHQLKWPIHILAILVGVSFIAHSFGLIARWYIAGFAPWSNGYESMVFIGWATVLAGLIFYKNSPIALAATSVLASLIMYVAHLSWMNPEITNLVPVLKSYWLTIHVAIITASYGFLALGAFIGFLNLIFLILQTKLNTKRIKEKVLELTRISELTLIVGVYLLTVGTFLGGIWANESWGRYWGWDPKETWAMVTILVYAFILHMRFIPGLKSVYSFNLMTLLGYFSVLMTYFGVNYYLSGLHSYAAGDPMPIPTFVYYAVAIIILLAALAWNNQRKYWIEKE